MPYNCLWFCSGLHVDFFFGIFGTAPGTRLEPPPGKNRPQIIRSRRRRHVGGFDGSDCLSMDPHPVPGSREFYKSPRKHEKRAPGCLWLFNLVYIGDEILPSYIGIIINRSKDPY